MLTTALARTSSIRAIYRLCAPISSSNALTRTRRSAPQFIVKSDGRTYLTKRTNNITNIFKNDMRPVRNIISCTERDRKYSSNKLGENKSAEAEPTDEVEDTGEEIPLLEINESYLDTQKHSIELVLRRDLKARDVKVYDFRDLNLTSSMCCDIIYVVLFIHQSCLQQTAAWLLKSRSGAKSSKTKRCCNNIAW